MIKRTQKLALVLLITISCRKETHSSPCMSVAYVIDSINAAGKLIKTDTAIYWPEVCDTELVRFMSYSRSSKPVCGRPGCSLRLVIWKK